MLQLDELDKQLLDAFQQQLPITAQPFAAIGQQLGISEAEVLTCLKRFKELKYISRVGPVFNHKKAGASTLAALAVAEEQLEEVATFINSLEEVNHNYQREHSYNLWFVLTAPNQARLAACIEHIEAHTGLTVLNLPMLKSFHIDLGFALFNSKRVQL